MKIPKKCEKFIKFFDEYIIHHVINIDYPEKIKPLFSRNDTIELFEKINYQNVKKYFPLKHVLNEIFNI